MLGRLHEEEEANLKAARFYNHIVTNDRDLEATLQIVMTR
jgi:hypothetical protein